MTNSAPADITANRTAAWSILKTLHPGNRLRLMYGLPLLPTAPMPPDPPQTDQPPAESPDTE